jgi:hypothetical protein
LTSNPCRVLGTAAEAGDHEIAENTMEEIMRKATVNHRCPLCHRGGEYPFGHVVTSWELADLLSCAPDSPVDVIIRRVFDILEHPTWKAALKREIALHRQGIVHTQENLNALEAFAKTIELDT